MEVKRRKKGILVGRRIWEESTTRARGTQGLTLVPGLLLRIASCLWKTGRAAPEAWSNGGGLKSRQGTRIRGLGATTCFKTVSSLPARSLQTESPTTDNEIPCTQKSPLQTCQMTFNFLFQGGIKADSQHQAPKNPGFKIVCAAGRCPSPIRRGPPTVPEQKALSFF